METVQHIFNKHCTDKNSSHHNYSRQYELLFEKLRDKPIRVLEIGVFQGESLKAMREVFLKAEIIVGLDINTQCKSYENTERNMFVEIGDATDKTFLNIVNTKYGPFDLILDDGSHNNKDVILTFETMFPLLNDHGLYIVEDTVCYRYYDFLNLQYPNHLAYFWNLTQYLNQSRVDSEVGIKDLCCDPFKIRKKTTNILEASIDKIEFGCSYVAVHKLVRHHWLTTPSAI